MAASEGATPLGRSTSAYSNTSKRFRITVSTVGAPNFRTSSVIYEVSYDQLSQKIQNIHRMGAKILRISEIS